MFSNQTRTGSLNICIFVKRRYKDAFDFFFFFSSDERPPRLSVLRFLAFTAVFAMCPTLFILSDL